MVCFSWYTIPIYIIIIIAEILLIFGKLSGLDGQPYTVLYSHFIDCICFTVNVLRTFTV